MKIWNIITFILFITLWVVMESLIEAYGRYAIAPTWFVMMFWGIVANTSNLFIFKMGIQMSRVLTFSTKFPAYHPRKGEPTFFVEKCLKGFPDFIQTETNLISEIELALDIWETLQPKFHTIRAGHRWKVGDKFSPRIWSGKPYNSKQIIIAPDIQVKKVWNINIERNIMVAGDFMITINYEDFTDITKLASNDGLTPQDLMSWFNRDLFIGQIICWNDKIEY